MAKRSQKATQSPTRKFNGPRGPVDRDWIAERRRQLGLTAERVGEEFGIPAAQVWRLVHERAPRVDELIKLAQLLQIPLKMAAVKWGYVLDDDARNSVPIVGEVRGGGEITRGAFGRVEAPSDAGEDMRAVTVISHNASIGLLSGSVAYYREAPGAVSLEAAGRMCVARAEGWAAERVCIVVSVSSRDGSGVVSDGITEARAPKIVAASPILWVRAP